jgi:hypothetical protein
VAVPVPVTDGVTAVNVALAPPVSVTTRLMDSTWFTLTSAGLPPMVSVAESPAGDWTVTAAAVAVPVDTVAPLFASVPLAEALKLSEPVVDDEQLYVKVAVPEPATA